MLFIHLSRYLFCSSFSYRSYAVPISELLQDDCHCYYILISVSRRKTLYTNPATCCRVQNNTYKRSTPYFCQTRSRPSDYSNRCWKQNTTLHGFSLENYSSFLSLISNQAGIPDKRLNRMHENWATGIKPSYPSPPSPAPECSNHPQGSAGSQGSVHHPSPSFLFCGGFPTMRWIPALFTQLKGTPFLPLQKR